MFLCNRFPGHLFQEMSLWVVQVAHVWPERVGDPVPNVDAHGSLRIASEGTLQETNISHLWKRKIIFKIAFSGDMLVSGSVFEISIDFLML